MSEDRTLFQPAQAQSGRASGPPGAPLPPSVVRVEIDPDEERESLLETVTFAMRSARRRRKLSLALIVIGAVLTGAASLLAPRSYSCEAHILVMRNSLSAALAGPQNPLAPDDKRDANEYQQQVLSRANIEAIVKEQKLVERFDLTRSPLGRITNGLAETFGRPKASEEQIFAALVGKIERDIKITIETSTVVIAIDWSDPDMAYDTVDQAVKNFTAARYATEVGVIPEAIGILQNYAEEARNEMERSALAVRDAKAQNANPGAPIRRATGGVTRRDPAGDARLSEVRRQIREITEARGRRINELNNQLAEMSTTYASAHPAVVALKATIEATQQESPALVALKSKEAALLSDGATGTRRPQAGPGVVAAGANPAPGAPGETEGDGVTEAQGRFEAALRRYEGLRTRIDEAKIEQQTANANFKHKYSVVRPADRPGAPNRPIGLMMGVGGGLLTLLLVLLSSAVADKLSGIFYEPRRVRDILRIPVLGETDDDPEMVVPRLGEVRDEAVIIPRPVSR